MTAEGPLATEVDAALPTRIALSQLSAYIAPPRERAGWLRLDINEDPQGAQPFVVDALQQSLGQHEIATYPNYAQWRQVAGEFFGVPADWLTCTSGCDEGIKAIFDTFLMPDQPLITHAPGFDMFPLWAGLLGNPVTALPLRQVHPARLVHDAASWNAAISDPANPPGLIALANPNNPTGTMVSKQDIAHTLKTVNCPVIIDETYGEFLGESVVDLVATYPHLFVTRSFSKVYGLAGLRIGVVISQPHNIETLRKVLGPFNVNRAAVTASLACMAHPTEIGARIAQVQQTRDSFVAQLHDLGFQTGEAHANFVLVHIGPRHAELVSALEKEGILIRDRHGKHPLMAQCVRIGIGSPAQMARCIGALKKALLPPPDVHTVLLDMDGTLVDVADSCRLAIIFSVQTLLAAAGVEAAVTDAIDADVVDAFKARGGLNNDWDCADAILRDRGINADRDAIVAQYQLAYRGDNFSGSISREPWLMTTETTLRTHAQLGIVTGRPREEALFTLARHGGPWPVVVGMEDMAQQKPAPDGLLNALAQLQVDPLKGGTLYVGDSVDDMRAACSAGCVAVGVLAPGKSWSSGWPERLYEAGATAVFAHIDEVVTWLTS
ncbi:MAG: aminotransferase class I/II-fold pyridoxal phosphate-dependent enzyme [Myxococcales bacterium]|nr:aminotransferase class I/II-fold pyridoxal phosphate-dependent enzyme [Myxococcales bacterium]